MRQDLEAYWKSVAGEFEATKDRIRYLIADAHWPTEGESKEVIFRKVLRSHISESSRVGRGFVCYPDGYGADTSTQIDVLVTDTNRPTLFREGDLAIVTPDAVKAIVEVKTSREPAEVRAALVKLADDVERIRIASRSNACWAGLFVYEGTATILRHRELLNMLQEAAHALPLRAINCVSWGPQLFSRYWERGVDVGSPIAGPVWHSYDLPELAPGYFLSNLVWAAGDDTQSHIQGLWYPIDGTKERKRKAYVGLTGPVKRF